MLSTSPPRNASWIWQSLNSTFDLVRHRLCRRIGNGKQTNIWTDMWITGSLNGRVTIARLVDYNLNQVQNLIRDREWRAGLIKEVFPERDARDILDIPLSWEDKEDSYYWSHSSTRQYTIQLGYHLAKKAWAEEMAKKGRNAQSTKDTKNRKIWDLV